MNNYWSLLSHCLDKTLQFRLFINLSLKINTFAKN